jgi:hypothetical protein
LEAIAVASGLGIVVDGRTRVAVGWELAPVGRGVAVAEGLRRAPIPQQEDAKNVRRNKGATMARQ